MLLRIIRYIIFATLIIASKGLDVTWPEQTTLEDNATFDYIIVGAGTAGCIVARRLAEDKKYTVLLLEAGGDPTNASLYAANFASLPKTALDYDFASTFDNYAARGQGNYTMLTAGKMLGGSSGLNHLIVNHGIPSDFSYWAAITEDSSWEYDEVLQYYIKSENVRDDDIINKYGKFHGTKGSLGLTRQTHNDDLADYLEAFAETGNPSVLDFNSEATTGYAQPLLMIADGIRQTTAYSYLNTVKDYSNLYVSKNTRVSKILFDGTTAIGVEAIYNDKVYKLKAKNEVIISAGVFNTPQILMLSGIGPKEHLKSFDIDLKADLPVGDNFIDQVSITLVYKTKSSSDSTLKATSDETQMPFPLLVGSVALDKEKTIPNYHTYNLLLAHDTPLLTAACANVFNYRTEICTKLQSQVSGRDAFYTVLANVNPKSRGSIRLGSTDPFDKPMITTGFFNDTEDLDDMVEFINDYIKVGQTKFFQSIGAELVGLDLAECSDKEIGTDEFWKCYILNMAVSPFHAVGTAAMGPVVDSDLKVKGIERLRVVDASIFPDMPHALPFATVVMVAEKASDMIKADAAC